MITRGSAQAILLILKEYDLFLRTKNVAENFSTIYTSARTAEFQDYWRECVYVKPTPCSHWCDFVRNYPSASADWVEEEVKGKHEWSAQAIKSILYMILHISFSTTNLNE